MKRCTVIIPDAGPFNSLWVADRLDLHLHLLSTVGMLRGLERVGVIPSADAVIYEMTHPSKPDRRPGDTRVFTDLPDGVDDPAVIGSTWQPSEP